MICFSISVHTLVLHKSRMGNDVYFNLKQSVMDNFRYDIGFIYVTRSTDLRNKSGHVNSGKSTSKFVGVIFH